MAIKKRIPSLSPEPIVSPDSRLDSTTDLHIAHCAKHLTFTKTNRRDVKINLFAIFF